MVDPLRIGIYLMRFPTLSETFIVTKVLGLLESGFDVQVFCNTPSRDWERFDVLAGRSDVQKRIHYAPPFRPLGKVLTVGLWHVLQKAVRHPLAFARFVRHSWQHRHQNPLGFWKGLYVRLHFVGHRLDILHVEFDTQALSVADLKAYLNCKLLLSSRGSFQKTSVLDKFPNALRVLYSYADGYHFISQYLRQNAYKLGLRRSVRTWLIKPAVDLSLFAPVARPARPPGEPLRVISVGRLEWQKGYEFALDAIARVYRVGIPITYTILGDGPHKEAAIFAARQWGLLEEGIVRFAGAVPREAVPGHLAEADVMLHTALEEGFCNAVIEAQATGLPVVTSDAGGLPENVIDGVTGFVVPRRDPEAMAEKLIRLARDPDLRRRMGHAACEHARANFGLQEQAAAFARMYRELGGCAPVKTA